jgi:hypothetical protein
VCEQSQDGWVECSATRLARVLQAQEPVIAGEAKLGDEVVVDGERFTVKRTDEQDGD